jgi:hypothetical protein
MAQTRVVMYCMVPLHCTCLLAMDMQRLTLTLTLVLCCEDAAGAQG